MFAIDEARIHDRNRQFAMGTRQLQTYCEVIEQRSFSRAAARLGITQPAVTLRVRALERRLGAKLIDRSGRRVEPTDAGRRVYRGAHDCSSSKRRSSTILQSRPPAISPGASTSGLPSRTGGVVVPELFAVSGSSIRP